MTIETTVNDLTIPLDAYPHLRDEQTLQEAIDVIRSFTCKNNVQFSEVLIINDQQKLVGQVTVRDILQGLEPRLLKKKTMRKFQGFEVDTPNLAILWEDTFFKACRKQAGRPIKEYMSPLKTTVKASDPLLKVLYIMMHKNESNLPVLKKKKIVGMIHIKDVFTEICSQCGL